MKIEQQRMLLANLGESLFTLKSYTNEEKCKQ